MDEVEAVDGVDALLSVPGPALGQQEVVRAGVVVRDGDEAVAIFIEEVLPCGLVERGVAGVVDGGVGKLAGDFFGEAGWWWLDSGFLARKRLESYSPNGDEGSR